MLFKSAECRAREHRIKLPRKAILSVAFLALGILAGCDQVYPDNNLGKLAPDCSSNAPIEPVERSNIRLNDVFWLDRTTPDSSLVNDGIGLKYVGNKSLDTVTEGRTGPFNSFRISEGLYRVEIKAVPLLHDAKAFTATVTSDGDAVNLKVEAACLR